MSFADDLRAKTDKANYEKTQDYRIAEIERAKKEGQKKIEYNVTQYYIEHVLKKCEQRAKSGKTELCFVVEGFEGSSIGSFWYNENPIYWIDSFDGYRSLKTHVEVQFDIFGKRESYLLSSSFGSSPIPESVAEYVLFYVFVFEENKAKIIEKTIIETLSEKGLKVEVSTKKSPTYYERKPTGKFMDKKRKFVRFPNDHYRFEINISW